jgi:hypothetical protein
VPPSQLLMWCVRVFVCAMCGGMGAYAAQQTLPWCMMVAAGLSAACASYPLSSVTNTIAACIFFRSKVQLKVYGGQWTGPRSAATSRHGVADTPLARNNTFGTHVCTTHVTLLSTIRLQLRVAPQGC